MAVSIITNKIIGNGNNAARTFSFSPVVISKAGDLVVVKTIGGVETPLTEGTGDSAYSVSVSTFPGTGSIDYPESGGTLLQTGESISMKSVRALTQATDLENQGGYFADTQEAAFDKLTYIAQQQGEEIDRSIKIPVSDVSGTTLDLPGASDRALKAFMFDALGKITVGTPTLQTILAVDETGSSTTKDKMLSDALATGWEDVKQVVDAVRVTSAVNKLRVTESITAVDPTLEPTGTDTDVGLILQTKGAGQFNFKDPVNHAKGANIASAGTTDIWAATGNLVHVTGTTGITSFGTAAQAGAERTIVFDGILVITHAAALDCPGGQNLITRAGMRITVKADTTTNAIITNVEDDTVPNIYAAGFINGLELAINGTDAVEDIDIAAGACRAENIDVNIDLTALITKQIDANWVAGDDAGGFPSGLTLTNSTWYNLFVIKNTGTGVVDAGFDTSATATNLLADATGYDAYRLIGSILRGSDTNIPFFQIGGYVAWDTNINNLTGSGSTGGAAVAIACPPGRECLVDIAMSTTLGVITLIRFGILTPLTGTNITPTVDLNSVTATTDNSSTGLGATNRFWLMSSTSNQVRQRVNSNTSTTWNIDTYGYFDFRGQK